MAGVMETDSLVVGAGAAGMTFTDALLRTPMRESRSSSAATHLARPPLRPIFEARRLTVQPTMRGFASYRFALLGVAETTIDSDEEKNRLCRPIHYWDQSADYLTAYMALMASERARGAYPALASWARESRLNPLARLGEYSNHPTGVETRGLLKRVAPEAVANMSRLC